MRLSRELCPTLLRVALLLVLTVMVMLCVFAPAWAAGPQVASQAHVVRFESLGLTNPGGCSLLVDASPGSADFADAVKAARSVGRVVFALGEAQDLLKAIPDSRASIGLPLQASDNRANEKVVSYYATFPNRPPAIGVMTFKSFEGSYTDLLASADFEGFLDDVDSQYRKKLSHGMESTPETIAADSALSAANAAGQLAAAGGSFVDLYPVTVSLSYPVYGRVYMDIWAKYLSGDTNPNYDYYYYQVGITSNPGSMVWGSPWTTYSHRFKVQAYGTGSTIVSASPSTTTGVSSVNVSIGAGYPSGVGLTWGWAYNIPDITVIWEDYRPSYSLWEHRYSLFCLASRYSSKVIPGVVEQVPQGAAGRIYLNGTMNWAAPASPPYLFYQQTQNNVGNRVISWSHP